MEKIILLLITSAFFTSSFSNAFCVDESEAGYKELKELGKNWQGTIDYLEKQGKELGPDGMSIMFKSAKTEWLVDILFNDG